VINNHTYTSFLQVMYKTNITFKEQMTILYKGLQYNLMYKPKTWINIEAS